MRLPGALGPTFLLLLCVTAPWAQDLSSPPFFEVVSIKPVDPDSRSGIVGINIQPGRILASNCTLKTLIELAYGSDDHRLVGLPDWADSVTYDVDARINNATVDEVGKLNDDQRNRAYQHMSQVMLFDRFQLKLHREVSEIPVYSLVVDKGGSKLRPAKPGDQYENGATSPEGAVLGPGIVGFKADADMNAEVTGQAASMDMLVQKIRGWFSREVVNDTGLKGTYDFKFKFHWGKGVDRAPEFDDPADSAGTDIFTALERQVGLKLVRRKGPVEILVVDHVTRPSSN